MDLARPVALVAVGIVLLRYAGLLFYYAARDSQNRRIGQLAIFLNLAWAIGSTAGLLLEVFPVNSAGKWAIAIVAEVPFVFAFAEFIALRKSARLSRKQKPGFFLTYRNDTVKWGT
jgi:uncharacterized membrane protein YecN with MAPEG domain